ncbi:K(+)-transporting ATPase subunit F [soil metagenome]
MKILKSLLIGLISIVAILLIAALFVKKDFAVEREITINKPKQEVFDYLKYLKNQNNFSVWAKKDPAMKKTFIGTDGTVGFISAWDSESKDVGKGEQEIKAIKDGERLDYEIRFKVPFEATNFSFLTTESVSDSQTKVKWGFYGKSQYPFNLMMAVMDMDKTVGGDLQNGLANLKALLEQ